MNKRFVMFVLAGALALPVAASAQVFGQFQSAQTLPVNGRLVGGYIQSSSNQLGLLGQLRLSFYPGVDFGFQGGFARQNYRGGDRTTVRLGGDLKYQIVQPTSEYPYSVSLAAGLGVETGDHWSILSMGPTVVGSRSFPGNGDLLFTPFTSLGLQFNNINVGPVNETDLTLPLRFGSELRLNQQLSLTGELDLRLSDSFNDDVGFSVGVSSPF